MAALTSSNYVKTSQFSAGQRTVRVSVMSSSFPAADCSTLTDQRLKSFMDWSQLSCPWHNQVTLTCRAQVATCRDCRNMDCRRPDAATVQCIVKCDPNNSTCTASKTDHLPM